MDSVPGVSLAFLYKNDPFYSLCLSDLMTAPKYVTNQFLKEQRNLTESLKTIDHCQLSRMAQLNEEKKQFTLLMRRRLVPRAIRLSTLDGYRETRSLSTINCSDLSSVKSSTQSFDTMSTASRYKREPSGSRSSCSTEWYNGKGHMKDSQYFFVTLPVGREQYGKTPKPPRNERCLPSVQKTLGKPGSLKGQIR